MRAVRTSGDAAAIRHRDEELQVDQVETHGAPSSNVTRLKAVCLRHGRRLSP
jgi:hypothetical protein